LGRRSDRPGCVGLGVVLGSTAALKKKMDFDVPLFFLRLKLATIILF
jgi:hypothetical protein